MRRQALLRQDSEAAAAKNKGVQRTQRNLHLQRILKKTFCFARTADRKIFAGAAANRIQNCFLQSESAVRALKKISEHIRDAKKAQSEEESEGCGINN